MIKRLALAVALVIILVTPVMAGTNDFLRGDDTQNPLEVSVYVAKTVPLNKEVNLRVKLERISNIGKLSEGTIRGSVGWEF